MLKTLLSNTQKGLFNNVHKLNTTKFFRTVGTVKVVEPPQSPSKFSQLYIYIYLHFILLQASFVHPLLSMQTGEQIGTVELRKDLFGVPVRRDILHRVVVWKLACTRAGTGHV